MISYLFQSFSLTGISRYENNQYIYVQSLQLTSLLAEVGLNIQEAHAFSTTDGYSLDVFVVDGWPYEVLSSVISELPTCWLHLI